MIDSGTDQLLVEVDAGVARITFNNPAKRNALSRAMREALPKVVAQLQADPEVRVVVMTGAGTDAFISGADISEFGEQRSTPEARASYDRVAAALFERWASFDKPVIAMIRGFCLGGGLLMALAADVRIASDDSQFAIPAARLGLGFGFDGVQGLVELVGPSWTAEILYGARRLSASEALRIGLVNHVVPAAQLEEEVMALAGAIRQNAPLTVAACKVAIREARREPGRRDLARVAALIDGCYASEDYQEGQRAFREKRPPHFTGR